jgi:Kelch motif
VLQHLVVLASFAWLQLAHAPALWSAIRAIEERCADGGNGGSDAGASGTNCRGAGAGGSVLVKSRYASLGNFRGTASGGQVVSQSAHGTGGDGRIRVEACYSLSGATIPSASTLIDTAVCSGGSPGGTITPTATVTSTITSTPPPFNIVWNALPGLSLAREQLGVATGADGKVYTIGGFTTPFSPTSAQVSTGIVEAYDPVSGSWSTRKPMPTARAYLAVAAGTDGKVYALGGQAGDPLVATLEQYDPTTNTWTTRTPMPAALWGLAFVGGSDGKLYAISGGNSASQLVATVEAYDPATDSWSTRSSIPTPRFGLAAGLASNGKIYAVGGFTTQDVATVEEYDPHSYSWAARSPLSAPRSGLGVTGASSASVYAIGGSHGVCWAALKSPPWRRRQLQPRLQPPRLRRPPAARRLANRTAPWSSATVQRPAGDSARLPVQRPETLRAMVTRGHSLGPFRLAREG